MKNILGIIVVVILVGFLGTYIYKDIKKVSEVEVENTQGTSTTSLGDLGIGIEGDGDVSVEQVPIMPMPSLDRKITFPASFNSDAQKIMQNKIAEVKVIIKADPQRVDAWIDLGSYWNALNDFEGARLFWEYAAYLAPQNPSISANLGFLYGYNLKNPLKGEENFLRAIANAPKVADYYYQTALFYKDVLQNKAKALAIINEGLKQIPGDANLQNQKVLLEK